jgi:hypothetical protein
MGQGMEGHAAKRRWKEPSRHWQWRFLKGTLKRSPKHAEDSA